MADPAAEIIRHPREFRRRSCRGFAASRRESRSAVRGSIPRRSRWKEPSRWRQRRRRNFFARQSRPVCGRRRGHQSARAISQVRSVEPESTRMISSAIPASEASARGRSSSSLYAIKVAVRAGIGNPRFQAARIVWARAAIMPYPRVALPPFFDLCDDRIGTARWRKMSRRDRRQGLARSKGIQPKKVPRPPVPERI